MLKLNIKLEENFETKLEAKLESKLDRKFDGKILRKNSKPFPSGWRFAAGASFIEKNNIANEN